MDIIDKAIHEGIEAGMYAAFANHIEKMGDCYDDPEDRCVMRPEDGCSCLYARWLRLPWYRRIFRRAPKKPTLDSVKRAALGLIIKNAISNARIARRKRALAGGE